MYFFGFHGSNHCACADKLETVSFTGKPAGILSSGVLGSNSPNPGDVPPRRKQEHRQVQNRCSRKNPRALAAGNVTVKFVPVLT
jgi:hypothetical protein